jgi:hypothetical protein
MVDIGLFFSNIAAQLQTIWLTSIVPFLTELGDRFVRLVIAPTVNTNMLWMVLPLVTTLVMMEFYFGRYSDEQLGWNTAVGNSIVLIFVSIDMFRQITRQIYGGDITQIKTIIEAGHTNIPIVLVIASLVFLLGIWLLIVDFFHILPEKLAFKISSSLPVNIIAYVSLVLVYTNLPSNKELDPIPVNDGITFLAAIMLFLSLLAFFTLIKLVEPKARSFFKDTVYTKATSEFEKVTTNKATDEEEVKDLKKKLDNLKSDNEDIIEED